MPDKELQVKILEAISLIVSNTEHSVTHKVEMDIVKQPFKKTGVRKTYISIEISEVI